MHGAKNYHDLSTKPKLATQVPTLFTINIKSNVADDLTLASQNHAKDTYGPHYCYYVTMPTSINLFH